MNGLKIIKVNERKDYKVTQPKIVNVPKDYLVNRPKIVNGPKCIGKFQIHGELTERKYWWTNLFKKLSFGATTKILLVAIFNKCKNLFFTNIRKKIFKYFLGSKNFTLGVKLDKIKTWKATENTFHLKIF